ncbi:MAG: ParB/RepB/Spo0J family partition protein [bacterium]
MTKKVKKDIVELHEPEPKELKPKKQVLGKGLGALLPNIEFSDKGFKFKPDESDDITRDNFAMIEIAKISRNPYQPRKDFDEQALEDLKNSIVESGVISAISVRRAVNGYELIHGERRLRACIQAGLTKIPAYILEVKSDVEMLTLALIENVQRADLNPIEAANGYQRLIEECNLTQEQVAQKIGKDRSTITNFLRLLKLPQKIQLSLRNREITTGHARALLSLAEPKLMLSTWNEIMSKDLSVRATENLVKKILGNNLSGEATPKVKDDGVKDGKSHVSYETALVLRDYEKKLRHIFGTQVKISTKSNESGSIQLDFFSKDDFERIVDLLSYVETKIQ